MTAATGWSKARDGFPTVVRADRDAGRDDDAHHGQAEDHDIGGGRRRPGRSGLAGLMPQRRERRNAGRWHEGAEPQAGDQAADVRGVVDRATRQEAEDERDDHDR